MHQTLFRQLVGKRLSDRTIEDGVGFLRVVEQERKVDDCILFHLPRKNAGVHRRHVDRSALHRRKDLDVATQHAAREQLDLHLAAAFRRNQIRELLATLRDRVRRGVLCRPAQCLLPDLRLRAARDAGKADCRRQGC